MINDHDASHATCAIDDGYDERKLLSVVTVVVEWIRLAVSGCLSYRQTVVHILIHLLHDRTDSIIVQNELDAGA